MATSTRRNLTDAIADAIRQAQRAEEGDLDVERARLRDIVRALHDQVDQTDPNDPIGVALTRAGSVTRP